MVFSSNSKPLWKCRCRHGYFHVVNNDYTHWEMYAIGGSAEPTINSQGNRYLAPANRFAKEVNSLISEMNLILQKIHEYWHTDIAYQLWCLTKNGLYFPELLGDKEGGNACK